MPRNLVLLGSTGSIGRQTLDVISQFRDRVHVCGLAASTSVTLLAQQAAAFNVRTVCVARGMETAPELEGLKVLTGEQGMAELAARDDSDLVVVGTAGGAGLIPTLAALTAGKLVALANKETLIMAGSLIRDALQAGGGRLVPIDSEHSAIWQCLQGEPNHAIEQLIITASGGALRLLSQEELESVTPEQALKHPTWSMGRKITIDSANLMNKGLEVLEASWLFDLPLGKIEVLLHDQSIVHSLVNFTDGSTKAQLGLPDMRLPIQYALSHPERWSSDFPRLDLAEVRNLTFGAVDHDRYPAIGIAREAGRLGGTYPAVLCAADEIAVASFLSGRIRFTDIPHVVEQTLDSHGSCPNPDLNDILGSDRWARATASRLVAGS